jgi:hypothetical protein
LSRGKLEKGTVPFFLITAKKKEKKGTVPFSAFFLDRERIEYLNRDGEKNEMG